MVSEVRYDAAGNPEIAIDPLGQVTRYAYDERNALRHVLESPNTWTDPAILASGVITTEYTYDAVGNLNRMLRAKGSADERATDYQSDGLNRLLREVQYPSWSATTGALTTTLGYDRNGNPANRTDPLGQVTSFGYNALNRPTHITYTNGLTVTPNVQYTYDAQGNRLSLTDGHGRDHLRLR